ncbi:arsenic resistance protein, partial [Halomonas sp. ALS9]|uniref:arsenic resistance protein n=1 Tax=Halomonas sp. ALS9 TaxID=1805819 RepID=UPI00359C1F49
MSALQDNASPSTAEGMGVFERYLSVWVALAIVVGILVGQFIPAVPETLSRFEGAQVSIPGAILIWALIFPMMAQIYFTSLLGLRSYSKGWFFYHLG